MDVTRQRLIVRTFFCCCVLFALSQQHSFAQDNKRVKVDRLGDPLPEGAIARFGTTRLHHIGNSISSVAFSPDGKMMVTGSRDHTARLWEVSTGRELRRLQAPELSMEVVAFSPDGKVLATSGFFGIVRLWDAVTGRELARLHEHSNSINCLSFSRDGSFLAGGSGNITYVWHVGKRQELAPITGQDGAIVSVSFSHDSAALATASSDGSVCFWGIPSGNRLGLPWKYEEGLGSITYSRDGKTLIASCGNRILIKEVSTNKQMLHLEKTRKHFAISSDDSAIALCETNGEQKLTLRDAQNGKVLRRFPLKSRDIHGLAISNSGQSLVVIWRGAVRLWDITTCTEVLPYDGHGGPVTSASLSQDGSRVMAQSSFGQLYLWDSSTAKLLAEIQDKFDAYSLSPSGKTVATTNGVELTIREPNRSTPMLEWACPTSSFSACIHSPNANRIVTGDKDGQVCIWDLNEGALVRHFREHVGPMNAPSMAVSRIAFSANGKSLAAAFGGSRVSIWQVSDGTHIKTLSVPKALEASGGGTQNADITSLSLSSCGRFCSAGVKGGVGGIVWNVDTGAVVRRFPGALNQVAAVSPDGNVIATAGREVIQLWELSTGKMICALKGHEGPVRFLVFSSDFKTLLSTSEDHTALQWDLVYLKTLLGPDQSNAPHPAASVQIWDDLGNEDARIGYRALLLMSASPQETMAFLKMRLAPVDKPSVTRMQELIAQLDSDDFGLRERAFEALCGFGVLAMPVLEESLAAKLGNEARNRVHLLININSGLVPQKSVLQQIRAIQILENIGTRDARAILEHLAGGHNSSEQTRRASAALERLASRHSTR